MVAQLSGAVLRALLVALLLAMPSLILPGVASDTAQLTVVMALIVGLMVFGEYRSSCPSVLEFRYAPPYNRLKFIFLALSVLIVSMSVRGLDVPGSWSMLLTQIGTAIGSALDFPYSPVRLMMLLVPVEMSAEFRSTVQLAAGVCYAMSLAMLLVFAVFVHVLNWPVRNGVFNVWLNLPMFDPTAGGDVVERLNRDAAVNIALGFVLPFLLPALALLVAGFVNAAPLLHPQTLIWIICAWAFLPASLIMRGLAMSRVAELITAKRRRAYAKAEAEGRDGLQAV